MASTKGTVQRRTKDPSALTEMEQRLHAFYQRGLTYAQIAEAMGGKWTHKNIGNKLKVIREKLECR